MEMFLRHKGARTSIGCVLNREEIYEFIRVRKLAVISSIGAGGEPQSALVGIAVSPDLEIVFDTVRSSRKYSNLKADPRIAVVVGWEGDQTVQYEGTAIEPVGEDLARAKEIYFTAWPSGIERQQWPGIAWFLIRPKWLRYSDFDSGRIEEMRF
jgi:Pyridoxamine 5'-phosphate oxidase